MYLVPSEAPKLSTATTRNYTAFDYPQIGALWATRGLPAPPLSTLPKTGKIAYLNGNPVAAGFLYRTDSSLAILEWVVADPKAPSEERSKALNSVILTLTEEARSQGCSAIFHMTSHASLIERMQSHGFEVKDTAQSHLLKVL